MAWMWVLKIMFKVKSKEEIYFVCVRACVRACVCVKEYYELLIILKKQQLSMIFKLFEINR